MTSSGSGSDGSCSGGSCSGVSCSSDSCVIVSGGRVGLARALVTLNLPESSPGDEIHAELSDGGRFPDIEQVGRIYTVGPEKSVEIRFEASEELGHCNLALLQNGHSRILPLWVGPPPALASGDPQ